MLGQRRSVPRLRIFIAMIAAQFVCCQTVKLVERGRHTYVGFAIIAIPICILCISCIINHFAITSCNVTRV